MNEAQPLGTPRCFDESINCYGKVRKSVVLSLTSMTIVYTVTVAE